MSCLLLALASSRAMATSVVYVGKTYVIIDAGKLHGLSREDSICILGADQSEVACGLVKAVKAKLSGVVIKRDLIAAVVTGMLVTSDKIRTDVTVVPASKQEIQKLVEAIERKSTAPATSKDDQDSDKELSGATRAAAPKTWGIDLAYVYTPRLPYSFSPPSYQLASEINGTGSLWYSGTHVRSSPVGVNLGISRDLPEGMALTLGLTTHLIASEVVLSAYDLLKSESSSTSKTTATDIGTWIGTQFKHPLTASWQLRSQLEVGAQDVRVKTAVTAIQSGTESALASADAHLLMFGARLGANVNWLAFDHVALTLGTRITVPLAGTAKVSHGTTNLKPTVSNTQSASSQSDLADALGLKKSGLGVEVTLGAAL